MNDLVVNAEKMTTIFSRQLGIFNPHKMKVSAAVVGVGAVGSFAALGLAKLGVASVEIWDMDTVEDVNLPVQMHERRAIGKNKALASKELIEAMMPDVKVYAHPERWEGQEVRADVVVNGVDDLTVRRAIWNSIKYDPKVQIMCDARIGGQGARFYYVSPTDEKDVALYDKSFPSDMRGSELPCTERGIIDMSFFAAALHVRAVRRWLVSREKETYLVMDLTAKFPNII